LCDGLPSRLVRGVKLLNNDVVNLAASAAGGLAAASLAWLVWR